MSNAANSNSTQNVSGNVSSVKQNAHARHSNVHHRSNARHSVCVRLAAAISAVSVASFKTTFIKHTELAENARIYGETIVFYKPTGGRMRGIAKMLSRTGGTLSAFSNAAYVAHHFAMTLLSFDKNSTLSFKKALKIRVSVVRFRPRPPNPHRKCASTCGVLLCGSSQMPAAVRAP